MIQPEGACVLNEKPTFILLPGFAPDALPVLPLKKYFEDLGYEVYSSNFWGDAEIDDFSRLTIEDCIAGVEELIQKVRAQHELVIGVGISLGGALFIEHAKKYLDLDYIVSVGTPFKLKNRFFIGLADKVFPFFYPLWKRMQRFKKLRLLPLGAGMMMVNYLEGQFLANLDAVRTPTLFIHSKHDPITNYKTAIKYAKFFTSARHEVVIVENVNHVLEYDSEIIIRNLFKFLQPGPVQKPEFNSSAEDEAETEKEAAPLD